MFISSTGNNKIVQGTPGDDLIVDTGSSDTIDGNGGNDVFQVMGNFNTINQGVRSDQLVGLKDTVKLSGQGNVVNGGDEAFTVTGGTGQTTVNLGSGNDSVTLAGSNNTLNLGLGNDVINGGTSGTKISVTAAFDQIGFGGFTNKITYAGQHNSLSLDLNFGPENVANGTFNVNGGTGYGTFDMFNGTLNTGGAYNTVTIGGTSSQGAGGSGTADITPGSGYDTVIMELGDPFAIAPHVTLHLAGTHNLVTGMASTLNSTGGTGSNTFQLNTESAGPFFFPNDSYTVNAGGMYNKFDLLDTNTNKITAGSGYDTVTLHHAQYTPDPSTPWYPTPIHETSFVTFAGMGNKLDASSATTSVFANGGTGYGTFLTGSSSANIATGGGHNQFTTGSGGGSIQASGDSNTVNINAGYVNLTLGGNGNAVFLNSGAAGEMTNSANNTNLHITVAAGVGQELIHNFLSDAQSVIALTGGAGGFTSAAQVAQSLTSDGIGGTLLHLGAGSIDFLGVAPGSIGASSFVIKP